MDLSEAKRQTPTAARKVKQGDALANGRACFRMDPEEILIGGSGSPLARVATWADSIA